MLKKIILILLTSFALTLFGQTSNKGNFLCQSDSVSCYTVKSLTDSGIKAIMTFYYGYYDGRTSDDLHYIIWLDNFNGHLKKITGCDNPKIKDTILNKSIRDIFDFYNSKKLTQLQEILNLVFLCFTKRDITSKYIYLTRQKFIKSEILKELLEFLGTAKELTAKKIII